MTVAPLWGYTWMCLAISSYLSLIIKNCTVVQNSNYSNSSTGTLAGTVKNNGRIFRCEVIEGNVTASKDSGHIYVGGVAGELDGGILKVVLYVIRKCQAE